MTSPTHFKLRYFRIEYEYKIKFDEFKYITLQFIQDVKLLSILNMKKQGRQHALKRSSRNQSDDRTNMEKYRVSATEY